MALTGICHAPLTEIPRATVDPHATAWILSPSRGPSVSALSRGLLIAAAQGCPLVAPTPACYLADLSLILSKATVDCAEKVDQVTTLAVPEEGTTSSCGRRAHSRDPPHRVSFFIVAASQRAR